MKLKTSIVRVLLAAAVAGLVLSPLTAWANDDDDTIPSQFRYEQGDNGGRGGNSGGADDGGFNADPNDWDVDSWDRAEIEPVPAPAPPSVERPSLLDRFGAWMRSLMIALKDRTTVGR